MKPLILPGFRFNSGKDTSFSGLNPSDVFVLHRTRIAFLARLGTENDASGPFNNKKEQKLGPIELELIIIQSKLNL